MARRGYEEFLKGVTVVDLTWAWAGPLATRILADLGADVIKVESPGRPDMVRFGNYPGNEPGAEPWHRGSHFIKYGRNKRSLVLDLSVADGREALMDVIRTADVFIESGSPRVVENLRLTYEDVKSVNPRIIMISMSGYGAAGPYRDWLAFGLNLEAVCGLSSINGYRDRGPVPFAVPYGDPVGGAYAALAALAALVRVRETGLGTYVDLAQAHTLLTLLAEPLARQQVAGDTGWRGEARHPIHCPYNVFPCAEPDSWVAIGVQTTRQFLSLGHVMGQADWELDSALHTAVGRRERESEIEAAVAAWTSPRSSEEVVARLEGADVPAGRMRRMDEVVGDQLLWRREFWREIDHPVIGSYPYAFLPWRYRKSALSQIRPASLFGEHTSDILTSIAGRSEDELRALEDQGVTSRRPNV